MDSSDFRQAYGSASFSAPYASTVVPVSYPISNPAPPAQYGSIAPGYSDVTGDSPAARARTQEWADRVNLITQAGISLLDKYGQVRAKNDPSRRVPNTGAPLYQPLGPSGPSMSAGQIGVLAIGAVLLIGIIKG